MFYSQFILAKKGPLGTIWIAAHLERKLRKNQVADTDIGVSVDSILFPEAPIALRLSSHLLLGVVRIYSRKVNYLFHDCSEALLKIKQAFRSTAVDLPPEESTAPYHSITLPETFDLDDFELPDSALLSGNFVDHHVSTSEQITLQDTLDGIGYSTSQFGLDERFGDGDAFQIGLDLDEELFLDNNLAVQHASVSTVSEDRAVHHDEPVTHTKMDIDEVQHGCAEDRKAEASKELSELLCYDRGKQVVSNVENLNRNDDSHRLVFNIQTPDLNEIFLPDDHVGDPSTVSHDIDMDFAADPPSPEFNESANVPPTPGLLEEAIPDAASTSPKLANVAQVVFSSTSVLTVPKPDSVPKPDYAPDPINNNGYIPEESKDLQSANVLPVVSLSAIILTEANPNSLTSQSSSGIIAASDAISNSDLVHAESIDPKLADISQVLPSFTSGLTEPVKDSQTSQYSGGIIAAPGVVGSEATLKAVDTLHTGLICNEVNNWPMSMDNLLVSGLASGIHSNSFENATRLSDLKNQGHIEDSNYCHTDNLSALGSDFHLRSCTSDCNQTNVISPGVMSLAENNPGFSFREPICNIETPTRGQEPHLTGSSLALQGEDSHSANVINTNPGMQKSHYVLSEYKSCVNNPAELLSNCISKDAQLDNWNCFSSSEFSEPERMLFAPSGNFNLLNELGQQTAEKGVTESDGSVDRISSLSGQKRHLMEDNTLDLQNGISPKMSGMPGKRRNNDYIPKDDDLLASILVGRTSTLGMGPTPPLPKPASLKRSRMIPRVTFPKRRKVLLDDTIVLHADAIRQQLINTEDIRRMRKKAPCTRPEIWRIQKSSIEEDIFSESIFTGISEELSNLHTHSLDQHIHSQNNEHQSKVSKELELSKRSEFVRENVGRQVAVQSAVMPDKVDGGMHGPSGTSELTEAHSCKNAAASDAQEQLESHHTAPQAGPLGDIISTTEVDIQERAGVGVATHAVSNSGNKYEIPIDSSVEEKHDDKCASQELNSPNEVFQTSFDLTEVNNNTLHEVECTSVEDFTSAEYAAGGRVVDNVVLMALNDKPSLMVEDLCNAKAASIMVQDMGVDIVDAVNLDYPQDGHANLGNIESGGASVSMPDRVVVGADLPEDSSTIIGYTNSSIPDVALVNGEPCAMVTTVNYEAMKESKAGQITEGHDTVMEKVCQDQESPTSDVPSAEKPNIDSFPVPPSTESERVPSAVGENSCMQEYNLESGLDVESTMEYGAARESSDFCSSMNGIDTDFLNVDDEVDYDEEANNDVPDTEEAQSFENTGWSSRTRGVARYLKTMFDEESGRGRKSIAIDHLLAGKTCKEASRMFFETLVLKTRDYIHVEQENPFNCINIKPRIKLLKSEF